MTNPKAIYLLGVCAAIFAAGLTGTIATRSQHSPGERPCKGSPLTRWLELDEKAAKAIDQLDPQFTENLRSLQEELSNARAALAAAFEDENSSDDAISEKIETCIAKHNALERRVAQHLLTVRDHLTPQQQKRLFEICAEGVRKGRGYGWGRGGGHGGGEKSGRCDTCGRGGGGRGGGAFRGGKCPTCGRGGGGGRGNHGD